MRDIGDKIAIRKQKTRVEPNYNRTLMFGMSPNTNNASNTTTTSTKTMTTNTASHSNTYNNDNPHQPCQLDRNNMNPIRKHQERNATTNSSTTNRTTNKRGGEKERGWQGDGDYKRMTWKPSQPSALAIAVAASKTTESSSSSSPRRPRRQRYSSSSEEEQEQEWDDGDLTNGMIVSNNKKKMKNGNGKRKHIRKKKRMIGRDYNVSIETIRYNTNEECESKLAFCCAHYCCCTIEMKNKIIDESNDPYVTSCHNGLWHRRCCHRQYEKQEEGNDSWSSPIDLAMAPKIMFLDEEEVEAEEEGKKENEKIIPNFPLPDDQKENESVTVSYDIFVEKKRTADRIESQIVNEDSIPAHTLDTSEDYVQNRIQFIKDPIRTQPAVVLDLFAGIGTGILALKKLGIAIGTIIYVEQDQIATYVYQANHDPLYGEDKKEEQSQHQDQQSQQQPDNNSSTNNNGGGEGEDSKSSPFVSIDHSYINTFEEIENDLFQFLEKYLVERHLEIDIVLAGPPCTDHSKINAHRQGVVGQQGSYLPRVGEFIQKLQDFQEDRKIYFLVENVMIRNERDRNLQDGDLEIIKKALGISWDPLVLDAKDCSPCKRERMFFSNIPVMNLQYMNHNESIRAVNICLDDNYCHPASIVDKNMIVKANCFMAHKCRIDDDRMTVYQQIQGTSNYLERTMNVRERERMMGFPEGYVERHVNDLFDNLTQHAYSNILVNQPYWKENLPKHFHKFSGDFHRIGQSLAGRLYEESVTEKSELPCLSSYKLTLHNLVEANLELAPPCNGSKAVNYYNKEEYAKRLIGNAYSVVVVEMLLKPLQDKFPHQSYPLYKYGYHWQSVAEDV